MKKSIGARTLPMPAPVWVVCTYDAQGRANAMTASWAGICCSVPPCVAVSLRKATYSYGNLIDRQAFTICVPSEEHVKVADYLGIASGRTEDKLKKTGLTAVPADLVDAPYIAEFHVVMECKVIHTLEIGLHTQFIGEVLDIKIDETLIKPDGNPDVEKLGVFVFMDGYRSIGHSIGKPFSIGKEI
jgi:flavin reductase (DIM6/NTAB) family NADH-FMN oxidoreductase RutF